ncbi:FAD dependent oxidoreductase-domain-containing protein [Phlebopus sp. FC_14]|nr:FAD dependent oxidoreductase-domain-containing protein [Phlebopus sp. FC_14]
MGNCVSRPQLSTSLDRLSEKGESARTAALCPSFPIQEPTQSFWTYPPSSIATYTSYDSLPSYADIVIIGSGISGASFARTVLDIDQERDNASSPLSVIMLEAQETCSGATGRNGGHINPPLYHDYEDLKQTLGTYAAQQIMRFRRAHVDILHSVAKAEADDADCRDVTAVDVFFEDTVYREAKRLVEVFKADMPQEGADFECLDGDHARQKYNLSPLAVGCIAAHAGAVHPYRFVTSVLSRLLADYPKHFHLCTKTPCTSITSPSSSNPFYSVHTPRGTLTASHVVHLTNAYVGALLPGLKEAVYRVRETMSAQRPGKGLHFREADGMDGDGLRSYVFFDSPNQKGFDYLTQLPNGERELMFGAGLEEVDRDPSPGEGCGPRKDVGMYDVHSAAHVSGALPIYFGASNWGAEGVSVQAMDDNNEQAPWAAGRVKALWSGVLSVSVDEFPWVGRIPSRISGRSSPPSTVRHPRMVHAGEWVAAGYSGEGMVHAWLCAKAVALMVLGLDTVKGVRIDAHGPEDEYYGAGQSVDEWLPACFRISELRLKKASRITRDLKGGTGAGLARGGTGKMKVYSRLG